jgi:high-affinity iron transporter
MDFVQGLIMAFREGIEAFLIITILLKFLEKTNNQKLKKNVWQGTASAIIASLIFGIILIQISSLIGGTNATVKLWESIASFVAVIFIITLIVFMIKHGSKIKDHIEKKAAINLSKKGIFLVVFFMIIREGVEIALFQFAGKYSLLSITTGLVLSAGLVILIYYSLVKVNLKTIFNITMAYLILQAGFLMGYSIHEGLSASKELELISKENPIYNKAFDLSNTVLNHKEGVLGVPLYVSIGWYSKPEWIQFLAQYLVTTMLFAYWLRQTKVTSQ